MFQILKRYDGIDVIRIGMWQISQGQLPNNLEEFLSFADHLWLFFSDLRNSSSAEICCNADYNRVAVISGLFSDNCSDVRKLYSIELDALNRQFPKKIASVLINIFALKCSRQDAVPKLMELKDYGGVELLMRYWCLLNMELGIDCIYGLWEKNRIYLNYLSDSVKNKCIDECSKVLYELAACQIDVVAAQNLVKKVFRCFADGKSKDETVACVKDVLSVLGKHGIDVPDSRLIDYAIIQCFGGE